MIGRPGEMLIQRRQESATINRPTNLDEEMVEAQYEDHDLRLCIMCK